MEEVENNLATIVVKVSRNQNLNLTIIVYYYIGVHTYSLNDPIDVGVYYCYNTHRMTFPSTAAAGLPYDMLQIAPAV